MQPKTIIITILLCQAVLTGSHGQTGLFRQALRGRIVDDSTRSAVPFAHIYNESKRSGHISDKIGGFSIPADIGDTLVISAVGYYGFVSIVGDLSLDRGVEIRLVPRLYEIKEVSVYTFRDYEDFKRQFLALELPKTQTQQLTENLARLSYVEAIKGAEQQKVRDALSPEPGRPLPNGIPILYRDDLLRINYQKVLEREKKQKIIDQKYNRKIIHEVTKLSQDEITDFMGFCNFSFEWLLQASEYEILVAIEKKFKEYLKNKSQGEWIDEGMILMPNLAYK